MLIRDKDKLLRQSVMLIVATQVGSVFNLLFQLFMMRKLDPVEYGILAAMLNLVLIVAMPIDALRAAVAHFSARFCQMKCIGQIRGLVAEWGRIMAVVAVALLLTGLFGANFFMEFFRLPDRSIVILVSLVMAGTLFPPLFVGALQGTQSFLWFAVVSQIWGVVRLGLGLFLVYFVMATAPAGLIAQFCGVLVGIMLGWYALKRVVKREPGSARPSLKSFPYFLRSLVILAGFAVLMNADLVMVKHYFEPEEAGLFARAATMMRSIVFLSMPIAMVMFPKVVSGGNVDARHWRMLLKAFCFAAAIVFLAALCGSLMAGVIWFLFIWKWPEPDTIKLMRWLLWALSPLGLTYVIMNFELAQHRFKAAWILVPCALAYLAGVAIWHETYWQIITVLGSVSVASLVLMLAFLPWRQMRETGMPAAKPGSAS